MSNKTRTAFVYGARTPLFSIGYLTQMVWQSIVFVGLTSPTSADFLNCLGKNFLSSSQFRDFSRWDVSSLVGFAKCWPPPDWVSKLLFVSVDWLNHSFLSSRQFPKFSYSGSIFPRWDLSFLVGFATLDQPQIDLTKFWPPPDWPYQIFPASSQSLEYFPTLA